MIDRKLGFIFLWVRVHFHFSSERGKGRLPVSVVLRMATAGKSQGRDLGESTSVPSSACSPGSMYLLLFCTAAACTQKATLLRCYVRDVSWEDTARIYSPQKGSPLPTEVMIAPTLGELMSFYWGYLRVCGITEKQPCFQKTHLTR